MPSADQVTESVPSWSRPRLVGRTEDLGQLDRQLERVLSGSFQVALVEGAAGVGKTRLVSEVLARHQDEFTRLTARSYRWGSTTSFGPWIEALDRHLRDRSKPELRLLAGKSLD
ncbi:MAG: AAA family ATPase, partial [Acidimicrobiia bacterium]